ncbi:hypothetical protein K470DRAFT_280432 [Piedraia hortae CBS 480.64]|uniref:DUF1275 domain protein n=1 Tax=Piedraia hortae CBS 480.64 TaxID=1314780 RepID=A0A6A7C860_9PEZI|nr:hypothetical protein K470DRAFT_280432 [Piedraia hortae CBS 480.64]
MSDKTPLFSRARLLGGVKKDAGDWPLLVMCLVTGMIDGACFRNWGMFVGMQTGNTVILGLSIAGLPSNPYAWLTTLVSIISFLIGVFVCFRISRAVSPDGPTANRLWTAFLFLIQGLLIIISAALATPKGLIPQLPHNASRSTPDTDSVLHNIRLVALIPPLALQSGFQIATSRLLGFNELPINVVTSTYCDLMGDPKLFASDNVKRNRRAAAVVLLFIGSVASGWLMRSSGGLASILWIAGGIKVITATAIVLFMPSI